jgi:hypothetical protein
VLARILNSVSNGLHDWRGGEKVWRHVAATAIAAATRRRAEAKTLNRDSGQMLGLPGRMISYISAA